MSTLDGELCTTPENSFPGGCDRQVCCIDMWTEKDRTDVSRPTDLQCDRSPQASGIGRSHFCIELFYFGIFDEFQAYRVGIQLGIDLSTKHKAQRSVTVRLASEPPSLILPTTNLKSPIILYPCVPEKPPTFLGCFNISSFQPT